MKNYTTENTHGFARINGHNVRMTLDQATRYAARERREFPKAKTSVYCLTDSEMVNGAMDWPEMSDSMEKALCN
jgi:hypothetical protein